MCYAGKEYRVVCTKSDTEPLIVDIVPADNALHQLIVKERKLRDSSTTEVAGSICLYDMGEGNKPEIMFLPPENGGLSPIELSAAQENMLRHKIIMQFEKMMAQNQKRTITVRTELHQAFTMGIIDTVSNEIDSTQKKINSPQEEQMHKLKLQQQKSALTRLQTSEYLKRRDEKYSKHGVLALQIKQLLQRDY